MRITYIHRKKKTIIQGTQEGVADTLELLDAAARRKREISTRLAKEEKGFEAAKAMRGKNDIAV